MHYRFCPAIAGAMLALTLLSTAASAQSVTGTLVANDTAYARWINPQTGQVGALHSQPPGAFTSANLSVTSASYSCSLTQSASDVVFQASSMVFANASSTHADLTVTLNAPACTTLALELQLTHFGDFATVGGFEVDVGNDGSIEIVSSCSIGCGSPVAHRLWTLGPAGGPWPIRVRTDHGMSGGGAQGYFLSLRARPWDGHASQVASGFPGIGGVIGGPFVYFETANYQLAALPPTQPSTMAMLRAIGIGQFHAFLIADQPTAGPLQLPSPFTNTCTMLSNVLFLDFGVVSATAIYGSGNPPRQWDLHVPVLPPGLTFYAQHASAQPSWPFSFGASNILRFDT